MLCFRFRILAQSTKPCFVPVLRLMSATMGVSGMAALSVSGHEECSDVFSKSSLFWRGLDGR